MAVPGIPDPWPLEIREQAPAETVSFTRPASRVDTVLLRLGELARGRAWYEQAPGFPTCCAGASPVEAGEGVRFFALHDPDGNRLEACQVA